MRADAESYRGPPAHQSSDLQLDHTGSQKVQRDFDRFSGKVDSAFTSALLIETNGNRGAAVSQEDKAVSVELAY